MKTKEEIKRSECPYGGIDYAWCGRIVNNMTDAEVIELIREIKRLKDCIIALTNHNKRIIKQNKELQQELRNLTQK